MTLFRSQRFLIATDYDVRVGSNSLLKPDQMTKSDHQESIKPMQMANSIAPPASFVSPPRETRQQILLASYELRSPQPGEEFEAEIWFHNPLYRIEHWIDTLKEVLPPGPVIEDLDFCKSFWVKRSGKHLLYREHGSKWFEV